MFEPPAFVAGFEDVAVMRQPIQQCGGHFGVAEYRRPFGKRQIGGDDDRGAFVEAADEVEQQLAARLGEWQVAEFVQHKQVKPG